MTEVTSDLAPLPDRGRRYTASRRVRLGDAGIGGTLRMDALARFLQDVANEDATEVGLGGSNWVVRRMVVEVRAPASLGERLELTTFCGGMGSRWAERRTTVTGSAAHIEASALWVFLDASTGRPAPLPAAFLEAYSEAAGGRVVSSRLSHPGVPTDDAGESLRRPWPIRRSDFDVLGHVNNAVYWAAAEDALESPVTAGRLELEYRLPIEPGVEVELVTQRSGTGQRWWLHGARGVHASGTVSPLATPPT